MPGAGCLRRRAAGARLFRRIGLQQANMTVEIIGPVARPAQRPLAPQRLRQQLQNMSVRRRAGGADVIRGGGNQARQHAGPVVLLRAARHGPCRCGSRRTGKCSAWRGRAAFSGGAVRRVILCENFHSLTSGCEVAKNGTSRRNIYNLGIFMLT